MVVAVPSLTTRQRQVKGWLVKRKSSYNRTFLSRYHVQWVLATTGVDGLEVIIAEAGISSWYNYYRENGLVTSRWLSGEDFDSLAELTYSRNLLAGDYIRGNVAHQADLEKVKSNWIQDWWLQSRFGMTATICSMLTR